MCLAMYQDIPGHYVYIYAHMHVCMYYVYMYCTYIFKYICMHAYYVTGFEKSWLSCTITI